MLVARDSDIRVFTRAAGREVDAQSTETYGIPGIVLMENAARGAAEVAMSMMDAPASILVCCGPGNNGGDGWAVARHLHNSGHVVRIVSRQHPAGGTDAWTNATIAERMGLAIDSTLESLHAVDLVVDALFGTGLDRPIEGQMCDDIHAINSSPARVLSLDLPSGLDADSGAVLGAAIRADATATFAGWKKGFLEMESVRWTGTIHTVDIGTPRSLLEQLGEPLQAPGRHGR